jgi:hypothetical protein
MNTSFFSRENQALHQSFKALMALFEKDYETSLMHCIPAIDKTASVRRPNLGVGRRFKDSLNDQRNIIAPIGLGVKMG